jgi:hypothetical protein
MIGRLGTQSDLFLDCCELFGAYLRFAGKGYLQILVFRPVCSTFGGDFPHIKELRNSLGRKIGRQGTPGIPLGCSNRQGRSSQAGSGCREVQTWRWSTPAGKFARG